MKYTVAGLTDEITTCDCCGKTNLKKTVVLKDENGNFVHYGCDCAALILTGTKKGHKLVENDANAIAYAQKWFGKCKVENLANAIRVKFTNAWVTVDGTIKIATSTGIVEVK